MPITWSWMRRARKYTEENLLANWRYKLSALAAAVIIWAYVAGQQTMEITYAVPIRYQDPPAGSRVSGQALESAEVTLTGRRDRILSVKRSDIRVVLDLSGLRPGRNLYLISTRDVIAPAGVDVKDITPRQVSIPIVPVVSAP